MFDRNASFRKKSINFSQISEVNLYDKSINDNYIYLTKEDGADREGFHDAHSLERITKKEIESYDFLIEDRTVYYKPRLEISLYDGSDVEKKFNTYAAALKEYNRIIENGDFLSIY